jgi:ubiquinone/menaquinone biosynthesis C-methylase UbiE
LLTGVDISPDMIRIAVRNAKEYRLEQRTSYLLSSGSRIPFEDRIFDAVFTNGSLHEWAEPKSTSNEIWRVLKEGGGYFISDLRRDMPFVAHWFLRLNTRPKVRRVGLESSIGASYTLEELRGLVKGTKIEGCKIGPMAFGAILTGKKEDRLAL